MPNRLVVAVLVVGAITSSACTDDDPDQLARDLRAGLADELVTETDGKLTVQQAECVADRLVTDLGIGQLDDLIEIAEAGDDPPDELQAEVVDAFAACDALGTALDAVNRD